MKLYQKTRDLWRSWQSDSLRLGLWGDVGSIPTGGALKVWQWTCGFRSALLVNKSAGLHPILFLKDI
jgi:hypothetical protein